jgi:predicted DNA-binding transcriptional regulator AlpA
LAAIKTAIPDAKLLEATPDFVGLTDIADYVGVTRQNMRKLMLSHKNSFPIPVHEGSASLWHLSPVLAWLHERAHYAIPSTLLDVANIAMQINLAKEASQIEHSVQRELVELVA